MNINEEKDNFEDAPLNQDGNNDIENNLPITNDKRTGDIPDKYKFGWSSYSEITNGRFAMIGLLAIIIIELFSQKSFLHWAGII